jgi:hypothetical protein
VDCRHRRPKPPSTFWCSNIPKSNEIISPIDKGGSSSILQRLAKTSLQGQTNLVVGFLLDFIHRFAFGRIVFPSLPPGGVTVGFVADATTLDAWPKYITALKSISCGQQEGFLLPRKCSRRGGAQQINAAVILAVEIDFVLVGFFYGSGSPFGDPVFAGANRGSEDAPTPAATVS